MLGHYDHFLAKTMNMLVQPGPEQSYQPPKKILGRRKDFTEGDVIYKASAHPTQPPYPR